MQADTYLGNTSDPLSLNLYTYCLNNPHKYTDPSGHFAITAGIVIGAIIWGIVGAGIEYKMQKDAGGIIDYNHVIFQGTLNAAIALISGGTANGMMAAQQGTRMTARTFGRMILMEAGFGVAEGIIGETGYQLIEGKKLKDLNAGKIAVSGAMGGVSGVGGALAGEAIGAGLRALKNTRVVSKAINTMQDMASRGKSAIRRGLDKIADFGRHQLGLDSVAYVTPEGLVVRGPRVPDNGMRLFAGSGSDGMPSGKVYLNGSSTGLKEFDIVPYGKFKDYPGDGLTGHELLQNAWLEANGKIPKRGMGLSTKNPAIALNEDPMHKFITGQQKSLGLNKKNLAGTSWRKNVLDNIQILKDAGMPREKIAELAWQTRKFAIDNGF